MIYQHEARGANKPITDAIDTHFRGEQADRGDDDNGPTGVLVPLANGPSDQQRPAKQEGPGSEHYL